MSKPFKIITSKVSLAPTLDQLQQDAIANNRDHYWQHLEEDILRHRVKFPILEYVATEVHKHLNAQEEDALLVKLARVKHESCYPVIGKLI